VTGLALLATLAEPCLIPVDASVLADGTASVALRRIQEDQNRADFLEFLYELDERSSPDHPHHHTYTGLFSDYAFALGFVALEDISREWHLRPIALADELSQEDPNAYVKA
jgi:hypothetical protein